MRVKFTVVWIAEAVFAGASAISLTQNGQLDFCERYSFLRFIPRFNKSRAMARLPSCGSSKRRLRLGRVVQER